jgi:hypothetical protein
VARYFFHLREGGILLKDEEGTQFADNVAACEAGLCAARALLASAVIEGRLPLDHVVVVADDHGVVLLSLTLGASVGYSTP